GWLARVGRRRTPWIAIGITSLIAMAITFIGSIERVAQMTNASVLLSFAVVNLVVDRPQE
ncbi:MAG: amino acid permease, partial [Chloroflexota bacterium]